MTLTFSRRLALAYGVLLPIIETIRRWQQLGDIRMWPAWLDDWSRWRDLPAARTQSLFVVDADRLHRAGPRFVDGMAELCEALDRARARLGG